MSVDGLTLLDKPAGMTSFSALQPLKRSLGTRRIGHTGTLDKFATGLLVVLIGRYTRLADLFSGLDKAYRAVIILGRRTDTLDPEGQIVERGPVPDRRSIDLAAGMLSGEIDQVPPAYSAVHVGGERAYRIARSGGDPGLTPRRVVVYRIDVLDYRAPELEIEVECSKGTYVRALARDLGRLAGSCAHLKDLRRLRVGPYRVEEALHPDAFSAASPAGALAGSLERLSRLEGITPLTILDESVSRVRNGQKLTGGFFTREPGRDGMFALLDSRGDLLAVAVRDRGEYCYKVVL